MPLQFPKLHIAESIVNRILNAHDEIRRAYPSPAAPSTQAAPDVPDPSLEGQAIDAKVNAPLQPVEGDPAISAGLVEKSLGLQPQGPQT